MSESENLDRSDAVTEILERSEPELESKSDILSPTLQPCMEPLKVGLEKSISIIIHTH